MTRLQANKRRALAAVAVLGMAATVAACSHHDEDRSGGPSPVAGTPDSSTPAVTTDAFVTYVAQVVATQDETSEPGSVDGVAATAPDTTEPQPVPAS